MGSRWNGSEANGAADDAPASDEDALEYVAADGSGGTDALLLLLLLLAAAGWLVLETMVQLSNGIHFRLSTS